MPRSGCIFKEHGISRPWAKDSKCEDENNLCFLQTWRKVTAPTPQTTTIFAPIYFLGSSKPNSFKFERNK